MITVTIDAAALSKAIEGITDAVLDKALDRIHAFAMDRIQTKVGEKLSIEQMQRYLKALQTEREPDSFRIHLNDDVANRLEDGTKPHDLKPGLLASPGAKTGKSGPYIDVPFLHRTTKRGTGHQITSPGMAKAVKKAAAAVRAGGGPQRLFKSKAGMGTTKLSDMRVAKETNAKGKQVAAARTYRRISRNSDESKWQHPGTAALDVFKEVGKEIEGIADKLIADIAAAESK